MTLPFSSKASFSPARSSIVVPGRRHHRSRSRFAELNWNDLVLQSTSGLCVRRFLLTQHGELFLLFPGDAVFSPTFSAVSPIDMYAPGIISCRTGLGIGLKPPIATRLIDSTPAQIKTSPAPIGIAPGPHCEWIALMNHRTD
ncbi:MAG: hypothetical protein Ct9H300mP16_08220 [Pseudomonadota bacterium]|nr:MAG: hypothetical protein Ct9H300mP16_08220 [Pseudomonadota bacterium]